MARSFTLVAAVLLFAVACSSEPTGPLPPAPTPVTTAELEASILESGVPTVVNVWASWCLPCRSEAPLIAAASIDRPAVRFIGLNVRDNEADARAFIGEYLSEAQMEHVSDRSGGIPIDLGGTSGVPITFFYNADGTLVNTHLGIIDEPALAVMLDEIDR